MRGVFSIPVALISVALTAGVTATARVAHAQDTETDDTEQDEPDDGSGDDGSGDDGAGDDWAAKDGAAKDGAAKDGSGETDTPAADRLPSELAPALATTSLGPADAQLSETQDYVWLGIAGLATFGASFIGTIVLAAATEPPQKGVAVGHAAVPVGGPFLSLAESSHAPDVEGVLAVLGLFQGLGLGAAFLGFTLESKVVVGGQTAWITPAVTPAGIGLHGRL